MVFFNMLNNVDLSRLIVTEGALLRHLRSGRKDAPTRIAFIDKVFRSKVRPAIGSVVMCDLYAFEHSGIYVGGGKIAHRSGNGVIELVDPKEFLRRLNGWNNASSVYVSCHGRDAIGWPQAAERALFVACDGLSQHAGYSLLSKNCHHFTRWCLTGDPDQWRLDCTFSSLEHLLLNRFDMDNWRVWDC